MVGSYINDYSTLQIKLFNIKNMKKNENTVKQTQVKLYQKKYNQQN